MYTRTVRAYFSNPRAHWKQRLLGLASHALEENERKCTNGKRRTMRKTKERKREREGGSGKARAEKRASGRRLRLGVVFTTSFPRWLSIISLGDAEDTAPSSEPRRRCLRPAARCAASVHEYSPRVCPPRLSRYPAISARRCHLFHLSANWKDVGEQASVRVRSSRACRKIISRRRDEYVNGPMGSELGNSFRSRFECRLSSRGAHLFFGSTESDELTARFREIWDLIVSHKYL